MKLKIYPGKIKHINFKLILILSLMVVQVKAADFYTLTDQDVVVNNGIIESSSHDPARQLKGLLMVKKTFFLT